MKDLSVVGDPGVVAGWLTTADWTGVPECIRKKCHDKYN